MDDPLLSLFVLVLILLYLGWYEYRKRFPPLPKVPVPPRPRVVSERTIAINGTEWKAPTVVAYSWPDTWDEEMRRIGEVLVKNPFLKGVYNIQLALYPGTSKGERTTKLTPKVLEVQQFISRANGRANVRIERQTNENERSPRPIFWRLICPSCK